MQVVKVLLVVTFAVCSQAVSVDKDLSMTLDQKNQLQAFRSQIEPELQHDYQRSDLYLIRWLRASNFDLAGSTDMLLKDLNWRKVNNMDNFLDEDWRSFENNYPIDFTSFDKEGRPESNILDKIDSIMLVNLADWNLRGAVISGQTERLTRYWVGAYEQGAIKVRELQDQGKNVTQWVLIVDAKGFSMQQQGCVQCLLFYTRLILNYQEHYPGTLDKIIAVNIPAVFERILTIIRPLLRQGELGRILQLFGSNKLEWEPVLRQSIDQNQLPPSLGGTKGSFYE